jgi:hypothetical protein
VVEVGVVVEVVVEVGVEVGVVLMPDPTDEQESEAPVSDEGRKVETKREVSEEVVEYVWIEVWSLRLHEDSQTTYVDGRPTIGTKDWPVTDHLADRIEEAQKGQPILCRLLRRDQYEREQKANLNG